MQIIHNFTQPLLAAQKETCPTEVTHTPKHVLYYFCVSAMCFRGLKLRPWRCSLEDIYEGCKRNKYKKADFLSLQSWWQVFLSSWYFQWLLYQIEVTEYGSWGFHLLASIMFLPSSVLQSEDFYKMRQFTWIHFVFL